MLDHVEERFEHSWGKGYGRPIQPAARAVSPYRGGNCRIRKREAVQLASSFQNNSEKFIRNLKTFIKAPGIFHHARAAHASRVKKTQ
jgi:hypothetical protein